MRRNPLTQNEKPAAPTKHSLDGEIITVSRGVAIYKTHASPYWQARISVSGKLPMKPVVEGQS